MKRMTSARTGRLLVALLTLIMLTPGCVQNMDALKETLGLADEPTTPSPAPEPEPEPEPEPAAPTAQATANATRVVAGEPIQFSAEGSSDPEGRALVYSWTFGDGHTGDGLTVTHAYREPGAYVARLTVRNDAGKTDVDTLPVTVRLANQPPVARLDVTPAGPALAGAPLNFSAAASTDPEAGALTYSWDFGDGATSTKQETAHTYARPGRYDVTLTVADPAGLTHRATKTMTVEYEANFTGSLSPVGGPTAQHAIPVAANATRINLTLVYPAGYGTNTLILTLFDAAGATVANATAQAAAADNAARVLQLEANASALAGRSPGDWIVQVELQQGLGGDYGLTVAERLS